MKYKLNKYTAIIILLIGVFILLNFSSCEDPISPYEQLKPGRRDYVWEIDTLNTNGNYIYKTWGSSPSNVWAAGVNGDFDKNIWHFDGNKWTTDGITRNIIPYTLCLMGVFK